MKKNSFLCSMIAACALAAADQALAATTILITDAFSGTNGASLNGRTPDGVDLPGTNWATGGFSGTTIDTGSGNPAPTATGGHNGIVTINVSTAVPGYSKPADFTISADLRIGNISGSGTAFGRGVGLGYFNSASTGEAFTNFSGLRILPDGTLDLWKEGVQQGVSASAPGGFNTSTFYNLTYSVDLLTGTITSVTYDGANLTSTFAGASTGDFTSTATTFAGFYASSAAFTSGAGFDNFLLSTESAVPEPGRALLLSAGLACLLLRRRRGT